jgi:hypothetical protein
MRSTVSAWLDFVLPGLARTAGCGGASSPEAKTSSHTWPAGARTVRRLGGSRDRALGGLWGTSSLAMVESRA